MARVVTAPLWGGWYGGCRLTRGGGVTEGGFRTANGSGSVHRQNGVATSSSTSTPVPSSQSQTVVVENPMSFDGSGKLVSNVVVGVTTEKK
uniref:Uncharacterized protein n=1 Tax=Chenopodium quinoa TaxID=63459 RepID=A0A803MIQ6_CHEQI